MAAIRALNALATPDSSALLVLVNFHRFLNSRRRSFRRLARQILEGKQNRTFIIVLSPVVQIPPELEKQFIVVEHEFPNREEVKNIFASSATGEEGELPDEWRTGESSSMQQPA